MIDIIQRKFTDRLKLYGFKAAVIQIIQVLIRAFYQVNRDIVFIIPGFNGYEYSDAIIKPLTIERINQAANTGELHQTVIDLLSKFIEQGCRGIYAEVNGKIAGYSWIQYKGLYRFGRSGKLDVPENFAIVKNLIVFPEFRGRKIGHKLNAVRLALIPPGYIPVGFIIPENRYAIRNWEKYGFKRTILLEKWRWFNGKWNMKLTILAEFPETDKLYRALEAGNH